MTQPTTEEIRSMIERLREAWKSSSQNSFLISQSADMLESLMVPEGWKDVATTLPAHGQEVIACNADIDCWHEVWDRDEPIGTTRWWIEAPKIGDEK